MSTTSNTPAEESKQSNESMAWRFNRVLRFALLMMIVSALLGATLGLVMGIAAGLDHLYSAALSGSIFGGWVGLVVGLSYGFFTRLRYLGSRSSNKTILVFAILGAIPGALLLSVFSHGLMMMLFQALIGLCYGASISGLSGTLIVVYLKKIL